MIATRTTPALLLANEEDAATERPAATRANGTSVFQRKLGFFIVMPSLIRRIGPGDSGQVRETLSSRHVRQPLASAGSRRPRTRADPAAGRDEHDHEEEDPDDRVERAAEERAAEAQTGHLEVADVVLDHDEREGAEPGALDPPEA